MGVFGRSTLFSGQSMILDQIQSLKQWRSRHAARSGLQADKARRNAVETQEDVWALALVLLSLIEELVARGVITQDELVERIKRLDADDGLTDGQIDPDKLRSAMKVGRPAKPAGFKSFPGQAAAARATGKRKA